MASLEEVITAKLAALGLEQEGLGEFVLGVIEEDSFAPEDKKEAIMGMLEADEDDAVKTAAVDELVDESTAFREAEQAKLRAIEEETAAAKAAAEAANSKKKVLTPEEELQRKQDLLKNYGIVEDEDEKERLARAEADKAPTAVYVDPKLLTKKARKKAEAGVDILMQPNLNAAMVRGAELHRRQEDAAKAAAKRDRDKADMKKQKDDAAKKAEDKKKKAQKVERRA